MSEGNVTKASASSGTGKLEGWKRGQPQIRRTNKGPWYIAAGWYVMITTVPAAQRLRVCNQPLTCGINSRLRAVDPTTRRVFLTFLPFFSSFLLLFLLGRLVCNDLCHSYSAPPTALIRCLPCNLISPLLPFPVLFFLCLPSSLLAGLQSLFWVRAPLYTVKKISIDCELKQWRRTGTCVLALS